MAIPNFSQKFRVILKAEPRLRTGMAGSKVFLIGQEGSELDPFLSMAEGWGDLEESRNTQDD